MKTILYLGLEAPCENSKFVYDKKKSSIIHYPIIQIIPRPKDLLQPIFNQFLTFTHLIFTSKTAVAIFFKYLKDFSFTDAEIIAKQYIAVGKNTKVALEALGMQKILIPKDETADGIVDLLKTQILKDSFFFWPHSALSRPLIIDFLKREHLNYQECIFYDTLPILREPLPDFNLIDEIVFTSPSTVDAFFQFFPGDFKNKILTSIGPITEKRLALKKV